MAENAEAKDARPAPAEVNADGWLVGVCPGGGHAPCRNPGRRMLSKSSCKVCNLLVCRDTCSYFVKAWDAKEGKVVNTGERHCGGCHVARNLAEKDALTHAEAKMKLDFDMKQSAKGKSKASKAGHTDLVRRATELSDAASKEGEDSAMAKQLSSELLARTEEVSPVDRQRTSV